MSLLRLSAAAALAALLAGPLPALPVQFQGYSFDAYVLRSGGGRYRETGSHGRPTLQVRPGEEYSIVVRNPLPVRAAVAVSIDGLNTIDGQRSTPRQARKWMIDPHGSITISGWQTSGSSARAFVFTPQADSYAQWREGREGKSYSRNLGVIGVAWFWNAQELETALHPPQPFEEEGGQRLLRKRAMGAPAPAAAGARAEDRAGTGMGHEQYNPVTQVEFNATAGMFQLRDILKLYYEFAKEAPEPQPFVGEDEEGQRFAPEMGK